MDALQQSMISDDAIEKIIGGIFRRIVDMAWDQVHHLGLTIRTDEDAIVFFRLACERLIG